MNIKPIIKLQEDKNNLKAYADVILDESIMIKGISVVNGKSGLFLNMPSKKSGDQYYEQVYPITKEFHEELTRAVLDEYQHQLDKKMGRTTEKEQQKEEKKEKASKTTKPQKTKEFEIESSEVEPEAAFEQAEEQDVGMAISM